MRQKDIFLDSEADAWLARNAAALARRDFAQDPVCTAVQALAPTLPGPAPALLEIGCGEGARLAWLARHLQADACGLDPSAQAVAAARRHGIAAERGTADALPFPDRRFDLLIFGFCLYLCDPEDLFRIAAEADRVLKPQGWLIIHDFYAPSPRRRAYHHRAGVFSHKMDFRTLFDWHPAYHCHVHRVVGHGDSQWCDDPEEWVAVSVLRKAPPAP